jgi:hypothetical protein
VPFVRLIVARRKKCDFKYARRTAKKKKKKTFVLFSILMLVKYIYIYIYEKNSLKKNSN